MDLAKAKQLVGLCQEAYTEKAQRLGDQYAVVDRSDHEVGIAFRGTASLEQWLQDADAVLVRRPEFPGLVHHGFATEIRKATLGIFDVCQDAERVYLAGHSLGAALALLAAWVLYSQGNLVFNGRFKAKVAGIYLFGGPRVGNLQFAKVIGASQLPTPVRVVNHNDIVPHIPPAPLYWHAGQVCYFDAAGVLQDEVTDCNQWGLTWNDHHIDRYVNVLSNTAAPKAA